MTKTSKVSITIPTHILARVDAYAKMMGITRSRAISDILWHEEVVSAMEASK